MAGWRCRSVAAEAVQRQDCADAVADRFLSGDSVGAGGAFLESEDLLGHRGGELFAPPRPWQRLVVKQQQRASRVRLQASALDLGLEVQDDPFVAEADAEVLKAPVPAAGLRQHVVELVAEDGGGVTARSPEASFAAPATMIVVEHPPVHDRVAQFDRARIPGALLDVMALAVNLSKLSGLAAIVVVAGEHFDLLGQL